MKAAGIAGVRRRKRWKTTIRIPGITPATDLVERDFNPSGPNVLWVADITYLRTGEGWLYLAAVQDTYSRLIVGWSMATRMRSSLVVDALKMALACRRPEPGLIYHSDQGGQYVSLAFGRAAHEAGIAVSMGADRRNSDQGRYVQVCRWDRRFDPPPHGGPAAAIDRGPSDPSRAATRSCEASTPRRPQARSTWSSASCRSPGEERRPPGCLGLAEEVTSS